MNKRILSIGAMSLLLMTSSLSLEGCYGQFAMTRKLYKWNGTFGNKWVNTVVMWGLNIIPVYPIAAVADILVLNTVEFWSGTNPVSMTSSQSETRVASLNGREYIITATKNRLDIVPGKGNVSPPVSLVFDPDQKAWFVMEQGIKRKIAEQDGDLMALVYPDGHRERVAN